MTWLLKLFTGLRGYGVAIGAALLSFVYLYGRKAGRDALKAKQAEKASEVQTKAAKAIIQGQKRVNEVKRAKVDTSRRTKFERP